MQEHLFFPTVPKITVGSNDGWIRITQYWEQVGHLNAHVEMPRQLLIPFLEALLARMDSEEIIQARKASQMWQDIITGEEQHAFHVSREDRP